MKFYIVLKNNGTNMIPDETMPTVKHNTQMAAHAEAERLAGICPGEEFVVMEAVGVYTTTKVTYTQCK